MPLYAETKGGGPPLTPGSYTATTHAIEDLGVRKFGNYPEKHFIRLIFRLEGVLDEKGEPRELSRLFNLTASAKGSLRQFATGLLGRDPGSRFAVEQLVGIKCQIVVANKANSEGTVFSNVVACVPVAGQQPPNGRDSAARVIEAVRERQQREVEVRPEEPADFDPSQY